MTGGRGRAPGGWAAVAAAAGLGFAVLAWLSIGLGAMATGHRWPPAPPGGIIALGVGVALDPGHPAATWPPTARGGLPGPALFWLLTATLAAGAGATAVHARRLVGAGRAGFASPVEVGRHLSARAAAARATQVRPTLTARSRCPAEVGIPLGRDAVGGRDLWGSLEDSYLVLGPPRSGKGVSLIIPGLLASPGPALVTATRPDTWAATALGRARHGPLAVFDPQDLTGAGRLLRLRWSPVAGCADPLVAILRARGLAAGAGFNPSTTDAEFWTSSSAAVIRCYLHAAALAGRSVTDVMSWVGRPADPTPVAILRRHPDAAAGWADELAAQVSADPRQRDGIWSGVRRAFDCLADPRVLTACSPPAADAFDPGRFLADGGTLYLAGSTGAQLSVAPLIAALVEDLVDTARRQAAAAPGGRLDPPLGLWLDEAANIAPLPSLPSLLADGGGSGICTLAVFQSLAQARRAWGDHGAGAMWDAATIKIILGGLGDADDLGRISRLAGDIDEATWSHTDGPGGPSWNRSLRRLPALPVERLRNLAEGRAIILHRRTPPVEAILPAWMDLPCAPVVRASLTATRPGQPTSEPTVSNPPPVEDSGADREADADGHLGDDQLLAFMASLDGPSAGPAPWNLAEAADGERHRLLGDLGRWVAWLTGRYRLSDVIPDCWAAHPALIEELLALRLAWCDAYQRPDASTAAPLAWHESFARTRDRIREWNRWGCAAGIHRPEPPDHSVGAGLTP